MRWFSFHGGHSGEFCRHAKGRLEDVVEEAHQAGFTTYGLSEHAPRTRSGDLYPGEEDLTPADLSAHFEAYAIAARALQRAYADRLDVLVGFEAEVIPAGDWLERARALRAASDFDFVIGSVHHVDEVPIDITPEQFLALEERVGGRDALDRAYFELVVDMVEALEPEVVGHLDLVRRFRGDDVSFGDDTWPLIERALVATREAGSLLDVNAAPVRRGFGPVYPGPELLARACELGVGVTLGDDSHGPHDVGGGLEACLVAIRTAGYREVGCLRRSVGGARASVEVVPVDDLRPRDPVPR